MTDKLAFQIKYRQNKNILFKIIIMILAFAMIIPLALIIFHIIKTGISSINWEFFTQVEKPVGETGGGILHSLVGTIMLILIASGIAIPLGVASGFYIAENRKNVFASFVQWGLDVIQGIPSIVIGIVVYVWIVMPLKQFSAFAGGVALALMMLPVIIKSTEETVKMIPYSFKEAALALGVPYYKTALKVILPSSLSGIVTGILIGVSRIAGETAPLIMTAFGNPFFNSNIFKPVDAMPLIIYKYAISPYDELHRIAWAASFVLVMFVLILNIVTRLVVKRWKIAF